MTQMETTAVMAALYAAYPRFYHGKSAEEIDTVVALWAEMFADDPADIVTAAVKSFITTDTKGYPPHIGAIKDHVSRILWGPEKSEQEAWAEVKQALSNSLYHAPEAFGALDPVIQRVVGSSSQLKEWAAVDAEVLDTVIASNFQRSYRAVCRDTREQRMLPSPVADLITQIAGSMELDRQTPPEPKALPISVESTVTALKEEIGRFAPPEFPEPLSDEEFAERRRHILASLGADSDPGEAAG